MKFAKHATYSMHEDGSINILDMARSGVKLLRPKEKQIAILPKEIHRTDGTLIGRMLTYVDITQLQKNTDLVQTVVEASPVPTIVSGLEDGRIIFVNEPLADLFDLTTEEAVGSSAPDFYADPKDRIEVVSRLKRDGFLKDHEVRLKKADGTIIWMIFNFITTVLAGEDVIIGTFYDISERKKTEDRLRRSEERFRQLAENIGELFWMTTRDKKELIYVNQMYEDIFGRSRNEIYSNPQKWIEYIHEEDRGDIKKSLHKQRNGEYAEEYRIRRPDGSIRWVSEYAYPVKNDIGDVIRICGVMRDITHRKESENIITTRLKYEEGLARCSQTLIRMGDIEDIMNEALEHLLAAFEVSRVYLLENCSDTGEGFSMRRVYEVCASGVQRVMDDETLNLPADKLVFDEWRDKLEKNEPCFITGDKLSSTNDKFLIDPGIKSLLILPIQVNEEWYGSIGFDDIVRERDWSDEDMRIFQTAAELIGGYLTRRSAVQALKISLQDLEETNKHLHETQTQLVQSEKMASLGMLVAGIAHEINTPIGAVNSMHNTMVRSLGKLRSKLSTLNSATGFEDKKVTSIFKIIEDANRVISSGTERIITIVHRLRSFARLDEAELQKVDIHVGLDDTLNLIHHEIKHNIKITRKYGDLPKISCFPAQLNQVFLNLLINARQAIEGNGEIIVRTYEHEDKVHIEFEDTGSGISRDELGKVFDPGFTTKGVGVGTGLGLSICYQIIKDHNGEITVESQVGKGSIFRINLPIENE